MTRTTTLPARALIPLLPKIVLTVGFAIVIAIGLTIISASARADDTAVEPPPPTGSPASYTSARSQGAEAHDGFYLRVQAGLAYTRMWQDEQFLNFVVAGGGEGFGIAVGGAIRPNLIVYGELVDDVASTPSFKANGTVLGRALGDSGANLVGVGAGLAYYLPSNVSVAGSLLASRLNIDDPNFSEEPLTSKWGLMVEGLVGKAWWVSDDWSIGASVQGMVGAMQDDHYRTLSGGFPIWKVATLSALFSATYN